jgi:hypothetical protein
VALLGSATTVAALGIACIASAASPNEIAARETAAGIKARLASDGYAAMTWNFEAIAPRPVAGFYVDGDFATSHSFRVDVVVFKTASGAAAYARWAHGTYDRKYAASTAIKQSGIAVYIASSDKQLSGYPALRRTDVNRILMLAIGR